ncbi:MAG: DUF3078 domain-containing protein [Ignavibacteriae bacterium]|nr:DUF3078 domain-containing protein [Ignavibacteriota bacterium]
MKVISLFFFLFLTTIVVAQTDSVQTTKWKHSLVSGLNLTQVALTDWAQGGENALAWTIVIDGKSSREGDEIVWANTYKLAFGQTRLGSQGIRKTEDKIDFESIVTYKLGTFINPYGATTVKSQFAPGYIYDNMGSDSLVSQFFDPGYLTQSFGVGYQPITELKTRFGVALREIITSNYNQYSDDPTTTTEIEKTRIEGGLELVTDISWQLEENLLFTSKIEFFSPLKSFDETVLRADNSITAKVSKYISANLNLQLLNDKKVSPRTQFKETIALGLSYTFF